MAVGLTLKGKPEISGTRFSLNQAREWLARAAVWFETAGDAVLDTHLVRDTDDRPVLRVSFHPVVDDAEIRLSPSGRVKFQAKTSPTGPGYHAYLCELMKKFAEDFDLVWEKPPPDSDPTSYFNTSDRARLERHFLHWLASACSNALQETSPDGRYSIGMPRQPRYLHPGPVLTPLGPHSREWLNAVANDATRGIDYFPWWSPELDAAFYRGRALALLWLEFRGRPPLNEGEGELVDQIAADLANAMDLDPGVDLPLGAWIQVLEAIESDRKGFTVEPVSPALKSEIQKRIDLGGSQSNPLIGYRQFPVLATLTGGWQIEIPGTFAITWDDDGKTWSAWDEHHTVWFRDRPLDLPQGPKATASAQAVATARKNLPAGETLPSRKRGAVHGEAVWGPHTEDGKQFWRLCGVAAASGRLAACNIYVENETDRHWAIQTWQSLLHG